MIWTCLAFVANSAINGWLIHSGGIRNFYCVIKCRVIGALLLLVPAVTFFNSNLIGIRNDKIFISVLVSLSLSLASGWFNKERRRPAEEARNYMYLLSGIHGFSFYLLEVASWTFYLIPYEFLMRGLLWTYMSSSFNSIGSVLLNCILYAFIHVQQGIREAIGAFLFGGLLCGITIITGSFWSAFGIHLMFALSNSFIVVKNNRLNLIKNNYE